MLWLILLIRFINMFIKEIKEFKVSSIVVLLVSVVLFFIRPTAALSFIVGYIFYCISHLIMIKVLDLVMFYQIENKIKLFVLSMLNLGVLFIPFMLCAFFPKIFEYIYCFFGLLVYKFILYFRNIVLKK